MSPVVAFSVTNEPFSEEAKELEALFREHSRLVFRTAYYVTRSADDAEDVAQAVFLHLLNRGVPPGLRNNPKGYLYRCAINLSLSAIRVMASPKANKRRMIVRVFRFVIALVAR